ncbi:MAG: DEAD/DEAH box helicase [Planctomycetes bacterium]|nr:DEAD/DEAH box helicase [Planctomycetota bacterium]
MLMLGPMSRINHLRVMYKKILNYIIKLLDEKPGLPVKEIAKKCRQEFKNDLLTKSIINKEYLYAKRNRMQFRSEGKNPPVWFNRDMPEIQLPQKQASKNLKSSRFKPIKLEELAHELHDWQKKAIKAWEEANCKGVVEAVTGTGKTYVGISLLRKFILEGSRCLVIVPTIVLFNQWKEEIESELGFKITSLLGAGHTNKLDLSQPVTLGVVKSISTASENGLLHGAFELLVADECHRYGSETFKVALLDDVKSRIGLTATFERSDDGVNEVLTPYFRSTKQLKSCVCFKYDFKQAKKDEIIAPFVSLSIGTDLDEDEMESYEECGKRMTQCREKLVYEFGYPKDFKKFMSRSGKKKNKTEGIIFNNFLSAMGGRKKILSESNAKIAFVQQLGELISNSNGSIVYVETKDAAEEIADKLWEFDFNTEAFHSGIKQKERELIFERFRSKETLCLVAVKCLDEGINVPDANCAIVIASSKQRRQMIQRMGRVLRKKHDETGSVFIHVYARQTAEDPKQKNVDDEHYLSVLTKEAECTDILNSEQFEEYDILPWIKEYVNWEIDEE